MNVLLILIREASEQCNVSLISDVLYHLKEINKTPYDILFFML